MLQKQAKYTENKMKALKARNDYILCIDAANAAINKYYVDDLPDMIDVCWSPYNILVPTVPTMHFYHNSNIVGHLGYLSIVWSFEF